jgi:predicted ATP-grasp superfamily ATP-dependent carboligase
MTFRALVCCGSDWWPYTRVLQALHRAGFQTDLIAPRGSIAASSRHRREASLFDPGQDLAQVLKARLHARRYDWVYVGDEPSLRSLAAYRHEAWAAEIFPVGPTHACFDVMLDKHAFLRLLEQLDVPVVPGHVASDEAEARSLTDAIGYPLALKLGHGQGGEGVSRVDSAEQLQSALQRVRGQYPVRLETWLLATGGTQALFAHGELFAWTSSIREGGWPMPTGPSSVRRVFHHTLIEPSLRRFGAATKYHGLCSPDWALLPDGGLCFMELNPRASNLIHHDRFDGVDFGRALVAFAGGEPYRQPALRTGAGGTRIHMFPQHVVYCVESRDWAALLHWLPLAGTHDIVWDDPGPLYAGLREIARRSLKPVRAWVEQRWYS